MKFSVEIMFNLSRSTQTLVTSLAQLLCQDANRSDTGHCEHFSVSDLHEAVQAEVEDLPIVKMVRSPTQVGVVQARMLGVQFAKGEVLVFLDSHCKRHSHSDLRSCVTSKNFVLGRFGQTFYALICLWQ